MTVVGLPASRWRSDVADILERRDRPGGRRHPAPRADPRLRPRRLAALGVAAADLHAHRAVLLFLLALGGGPGLAASRSAGPTRSACPHYLRRAPRARAAAGPARLLRRLRARPGSPRSTCCCSSRCSAASSRARPAPAQAHAGAAAGGAAQPRPAAGVTATFASRRTPTRSCSTPPRPSCAGAFAGRASHGGRRRWVAAEKGYLRETGNLVFHLSLVVLLARGRRRRPVRLRRASARGRGQRLRQHRDAVRLVQRRRWPAATAAAVLLHPRRLLGAATRRGGPQTGRRARSTRTCGDGRRRRGARARRPSRSTTRCRRRHQGLPVGHGYAPTFTVRDGQGGRAVDGGRRSCRRTATSPSQGVIKVPDARPTSSASGRFFPTAARLTRCSAASRLPRRREPRGRCCALDGRPRARRRRAQSVYRSTPRAMTQARRPGQLRRRRHAGRCRTGTGTITFDGLRQWATFAVAPRPGQGPALVAALAASSG